MNTFLRKQGQYLLANELYAFLVAAVLALTPITMWLSLAVVALVTLRHGSVSGLKVFACGLVVAYVAYQFTAPASHVFSIDFITFIVGFSAAIALRITANWRIVIFGILIAALLSIGLIHMLLPNYAYEQYTLLLNSLKEIDSNYVMAQLLESQQRANPTLILNSLLGIRVLSIVFSALSSLMLARGIQSALFYPGGFRKEMLAFRASRAGVLLLVIAAFGVYQNNPIAISCLPLLVVYLMSAGISLLFNMMARKKDLVIIFLIVVPLIIVPYIMLPVYVFFGSLDSLFDLRLRLAANQKFKN
ncbi:membrane protein [Legionella beliardensis]|uniref:Membrane protein n=1 Tax=Legionella beliardensis TaxID=91822 RepID=A0A378I3A5_9GAMM|nr:hypothetical protein [Legionella beliardensis]STX29166.1 membrane protein [Legionella beliardensis]